MKQTIEKDISFKRLSENEEYYKYIFKKTEKIVSVVFYILSNTEKTDMNEALHSDLADQAKIVHRRVLDTLSHFEHAADEVLTALSHDLIALDSTIRIASAGGVVGAEVAAVVLGEIEVVLRGINNRYLRKMLAFSSFDSVPSQTYRRRRNPQTDTATPAAAAGDSDPDLPASPSRATPAAVTYTPDRRARIQTILEARGESTIKDISDIITDVSEKTIQRELNAMIEDNLIRREGERRWSKYLIN